MQQQNKRITPGTGGRRHPEAGQIQIQLEAISDRGKHKCESLTSYRTYAGLVGLCWFFFPLVVIHM